MFRSFRPKSESVFARADARDVRRGVAAAKIVVFTIAGFITGAIWLATVTTVPELVRAHGTLIPAGHYQQLQAPEHGIVAQVLVEEGERVEKDQVLTVLSSPELDNALQEARREQNALETRLQNLHVILETIKNDLDFVPAAIDAPDGTDLSYASSQIEVFRAKQTVQIKLRRHLEITLETLKNAQVLTQKRIEERIDRVSRAKNLYEQNLTRRRDLESEQDGLDQLQANLIEIEIRLSQAEKDLGGVGVTLEQNLISLQEKTNTEQFDLEQRLKMLAGQATALEKRIGALQIRALEAGVVHAIGFPNTGEVIAAGTTLFELIPAGRRLVAQLEIDPVDIGHIKSGDAVALKFDTFDARRFGQVEGRITSISPNSVVDVQTGTDHFRATVFLNNDSIGRGVWERQLKAGMGTSAEIVTDERTVLAYLIKPINRSFNNAFGER